MTEKDIDACKIKNHLREYNNEELLQVLQNIEIQPFNYLTCICAEILRRSIDSKQIKL